MVQINRSMKNTYKIWDNVNKSFLYDLSNPQKNGLDPPVLKFKTKKSAEQYKDDFLSAGNYIDRPHTVLQIIKTEDCNPDFFCVTTVKYCSNCGQKIQHVNNWHEYGK